MSNTFNLYNFETVNYNNTCNGVTGQTVTSYNVIMEYSVSTIK